MSTDSWMPKPPPALTIDLYKSNKQIEDVDTAMWHYLLSLIPDDKRPYSVQSAEMLNSVSPELRRYFLTRGFDWRRGSAGLEGCFMVDDLNNNYNFPEDTAKAFESLGAVKQAAIIRELIPKAQIRDQQFREAKRKGQDFNFDDGFWKPYEKRWDDACCEFDFYEVIWKDIQAHPERYAHKK